MFTSYNKCGLQATRVGNWQEELALQAATGCSRAPKPGPETRETSFNKRLIEHSAQVEAKDYVSTTQAAHRGQSATRPPVRPLLRVRRANAQIGVRTQLFDREFQAIVDRDLEVRSEHRPPVHTADCAL